MTAPTSGRRAMPLSEWPEADQAGWLLANQPEDPLDDTIGYAQRWRPATRKLTQEGYGYWLDWLARSGQLSFRGIPQSEPHQSAFALTGKRWRRTGLRPTPSQAEPSRSAMR